MICLAFGLSMDYQIFLLARIREEHNHTGDNAKAVAIGLTTTAKIISVAAVLIPTVLLAIETSGISLSMVPSLMPTLDKVNWWAPKFFAPQSNSRIGVQ
ncbi:MMPL family transporter [Mycobacterium haemophilum]